MKIKRWYYKNNYEDFYVLYEDGCFILVQNIETRKYDFGYIQDFGSFYGFPVNQSCLNKKECIEKLERFIEIDKKYDNQGTIEVWDKMIKKLKECK